MADLTSSSVTINRSAAIGSKSNKLVDNRYYMTAVLASHGTLVSGNRIPASAFGITKVTRVSNFVDSGGATVIPAGIDPTSTYVILGGGAANALANYTGTYSFVLDGH